MMKKRNQLGYDILIILARNLRTLKNRARAARKQGGNADLLLGFKQSIKIAERGLKEIKERYNYSCFALPGEILKKRNERNPRLNGSDFLTIKYLLKLSDERMDALQSVLVDGETYQTAADRHGWTRQAVGKTVKLFWDTLQAFVDDQQARIAAHGRDK